MPTLLEINTSPLATSITRELTAEYVRTWKANHTDGEILSRDLAANPSKPLDGAWVGAAYTPEAARTTEQKARLAESDQLIAELEQANEYVIGVSMHNFSIPSVLKLWIDQVARNGKTFSYGAGGPKGLLQGKKATVLIASGGFYEPGTPGGAMNFVEPYLRSVLSFLGVMDVTFVTASGVSQVNSGKTDRASFLKPTIERVRALAA